ncbi:MAG TPA: hypothetical protein PLM14_02085 [Candidatus Hydrogenedentes bacterium]|nr:hypothetical protein [Candidatus Hydrogenedentota bacterium]HQE81757.1 hypothetical protein [Candidatus Hydrogenedentota bacterium]HQH52976.1 hypothetical protein [Candidatus Hydrogenedentota bacterium]HQM49542.1 hypothetical protein [Candidatus Hydrogenedentota bacterium]
MGCCLGVVALIFPRIALFVMWLSGYGGRAFDTILWPLLGFFFMPYTTCGYAFAANSLGGLKGWGLAALIVGVVLDVASHGGGARSGHHYYQRVRVHRHD